MKLFLTIFSITLLTVATSTGQSLPDFNPPLKIPLSMSANFGELRPDHFHSGIDLKTEGVTGKEVVAADSGFVYLILVSPVGFGKAIFLRHPSGYSTVYGHLDAYAPEIEEYVKAQQYRSKSFPVTIYPPDERFRVKRGQLIGYSGNTGGSSGPHLHFEVRKSNSERPVNPEMFNFQVTDNIKPSIIRLVVYPLDENTTINGQHTKTIFSVYGSDGRYRTGQEIRISGKAGFGITSYDYMNNSGNRFGVNSIELDIDSLPVFIYSINEFGFDESRYINAHIDYEEAIRNNLDIEKTFVLPNDRLTCYKKLVNRGIFDFADTLPHKVSITVKDGKENSSSLSFTVKPGFSTVIQKITDKDQQDVPMLYDRENVFSTDKIKLSIPSGALYDTLRFRYFATPRKSYLFSAVHHIHDIYTPLQKPATLSIKPDSLPVKSSKLLLVKVDEKGLISSAGGSYSNGFVTGTVLTFGNYAVGIDTIAPVINGNGLASSPDYTGRSELRVKIRDDFSGIKSYSVTIDGSWALFEYDAKNDVLIYRFDSKKITRGTKHTLVITVSDKCDNVSSVTRYFTW